MYYFIAENMRVSRYLLALCIYDDAVLRNCLYFNAKTEEVSPILQDVFTQKLEKTRN
jgi:hypothetical protein